MVVFEQSGCVPAKVVLFGQKWLYSVKVVVFGQIGCIRQNGCFRAINGCI